MGTVAQTDSHNNALPWAQSNMQRDYIMNCQDRGAVFVRLPAAAMLPNMLLKSNTKRSQFVWLVGARCIRSIDQKTIASWPAESTIFVTVPQCDPHGLLQVTPSVSISVKCSSTCHASPPHSDRGRLSSSLSSLNMATPEKKDKNVCMV